MTEFRKLVPLCCAALVALSGAALADGYEYEGKAMAAPEEGRKFTYSFNLGGTSDYVFRGFSQTGRDPTIQGGADFGWGSLYLGVWASGLDFGDTLAGAGIANAEVDIYGGYTPSWDTKTIFGKVDFDFGVIYYAYPSALDAGAELDYVEFKAGYTTKLWSFLIPGLSSGTTVYYSPEYTGEVGPVWTVESTYAWTGHEIRGIKPTISALLGWQTGDNAGWIAVFGNGDDEYYYWNAGLELAIENISFDFRYWDTDVKNNNAGGGGVNGFCTGPLFQCDQAFVFTVKVAVP